MRFCTAVRVLGDKPHACNKPFGHDGPHCSRSIRPHGHEMNVWWNDTQEELA